MVRVSIGSVSRLETRFRAQPVGVKGAFSRRGTSIQSGAIARLRDFGLSRSVLWVTNHRIRRLPQARLVRSTIRAFVAADNFNVRHVHTMNFVADLCSIIFIALFSYVMVGAYLLRWMIDDSKVRDSGAKIFRHIAPPRDVLTDRGVKVWWSRWFALVGALVFLFLSYFLHHR
jgi:hypothetical protein